jgi:hypothetical protein
MKFVTKFYGFLSARIEVLKKAFDVRDVLILSGLLMLWYGLNLVYPWLSFTVCGALILAGGLLYEDKK